MNYLKINIIVARHFGITPELVMNSPRCDARMAAYLICQEVLNASTIKLAKWYNKRNHTTPMRAIRTARGFLETNKIFNTRYTAALMEVEGEVLQNEIEETTNLEH